jgi:hypothetical protein
MNKYSKSNITDEILDKVEDAVGMGNNAWDCVDPKEIIAAAWNELDKSQEKRIKLLCEDWAEDHTYLQNLCRRLGYSEVEVDGNGTVLTTQQLADMLFAGPQGSVT